MTCIVAIKENNEVYIAGDSAGSSSYLIEKRVEPKVFRNGDYVIGFSSSFRMGQLLAYTQLPTAPKENIMKFMVTEFIDAVRDIFKKGGYAEKDKEVEKGGFFIVGINGRIFTIESDYQVGETILPYAAIGSGREVALGSLATSSGDAQSRLFKALEVSSMFCSSVCSPFNMVGTGKI